MGFFEALSPEIDRYLEEHASFESALLKRLRKETYQRTTQPHMISGVYQGRLLSMISKIYKPKNALEIGTFTGYATLCLAEGLADDGKITTLDINEDLAYLPKKYFAESDYSAQIHFSLQDAKVFLENSTDTYDLIFVDADKNSYPYYFNLLKNRVASGSIIMFDNVLWYGKVLEENPKLASTIAIKELNDLVQNDPEFENLILPLRDGIHLIRKL